VPANRGVNSRGDGTLFDRTEFTYQPESDTFLCPAGQTLPRNTNAERSCRALCSTTRSLRSLPSEIALHGVAATDSYVERAHWHRDYIREQTSAAHPASFPSFP
jgi:hypothetical protein